jgi:hypothetical protein
MRQGTVSKKKRAHNAHKVSANRSIRRRVESAHKPSHSWAALQSIQAARIGGVSMLIVHEVHVFTQSAARALAKKWGLKFVPNDSRKRPGKVFDGRKTP